MPLKIKWIKGVAHVHGTVAGRRIRKGLGTRDPQLAEHQRAQIEGRLLRASIYGEESEITFAEACLKYLEEGGEGRFIAPILKAFGPDQLVAKIKPGDVRALARELYPHAKPGTLNRQVITPVQAVINYAADRGWCAPIRIRRFKEVQAIKRAANRAWIEAYCAAEKNPYLRAARRFMFETGARISDVVAIQPHNLDLDNGRIWLERTKNDDPGEFLMSEALTREIATLTPKRFPDRSQRVFGYKTRFGMAAAMKKTCERAGLAYLTPHEAGRHSFATELVTRQGIDAATVAKLGRWKSPQLLMSRYVHPNDLPEIVNAAFGDGTGKFLTSAGAKKPQATDKKRKNRDS